MHLKKHHKYIIATAAVLASGASVYHYATPPQPIAFTPAIQQCNDLLWKHVYHPDRLIVHNKCMTVTGTMMDATNGRQKDGVRHEADGDIHGWLKVDPEFIFLVNQGNVNNEQGNLIFEIICHFKITQQDAIDSCGNFRDMQIIPPIGSHVSITGSYVMDTNHAQWMEIHPVSKISIIQ